MLFKKSLQKTHVVIELQPEGVAVAFMRQGMPICEFLETKGNDPYLELQSYLKQNQLQENSCHFILTEHDYRLLMVERPNVPDDEQKMALPWLVKDLIDIPVGEAAIDAFELPCVEGDTQKLYAVIATSERLQEIRRLIQHVHLQITRIDIRELAVHCLVCHYQETTDGVAVLMRNDDTIKMLILKDGYVHYIRKVGQLEDLKEEGAREALMLELQRSLDFAQVQLRMHNLSQLLVIGVLELQFESFEQQITLPIKKFSDVESVPAVDLRCSPVFGALLAYETNH